MAKPLRFEYSGAIFHVMALGDGGKVIFIEKEDHLLFGKLTEYEWSSLRLPIDAAKGRHG